MDVLLGKFSVVKGNLIKIITPSSSLKCVILYANLGPYHIAHLEALEDHIPGVLTIEIAGKQKLYPWRTDREGLRFQYVTLFDIPYEDIPSSKVVSAITETLNEFTPAVIVAEGYFMKASRAASRWARNHGSASIMTTDTTEKDRSRNWVREKLKGRWCRKMYDALFLSGERSARYFGKLGFPKDRIWYGCDGVDNEHFSNFSTLARLNADSIRMNRGLPDRYFLMVGRHAPEKNLFFLLQSFIEYRKRGGEWNLVLVGSGPESDDIKTYVEENRINKVKLVPWAGYDELPDYYTLASCLILPSFSEPWGLVVNEAMVCGCPVLVSSSCGCMPELCHRGINGYDFNPNNTEELVEKMLRMSSGDVDLASMGAASEKIVSNYSPNEWAKSLSDCIESALKKDFSSLNKTL